MTRNIRVAAAQLGPIQKADPREAVVARMLALMQEARGCDLIGYPELTPDGHHFNTSILVDKAGAILGKYRKVHLPGHDEFDPQRTHQHLEKRYFEPGDLGFPVWRELGGILGMAVCNDRR